ncbi:MAG: MgtC/SapB family protein [Oscillospiraceae bacterium]|nr:MgtC/SapB family protein [Oscillospiraceae bacterium]
MEPGIAAICLRLFCAMLVGMLIGMEREFTHRPAGLRTHILVALGACVASLMGEMIFTHYNSSADPARLSAQVITGVGFLGAGTFMKEGVNVKGLTTAASVWAVACLGIAAGFGFYVIAVAGMIFTLITLTIFEALQRKLIHNHSAEDRFLIRTTDVPAALELINKAAAGSKVTIFELNATRQEDGYRITFRAWFTGRKNEQRRREFFAKLVSDACIEEVSYQSNAESKV